MKKLWIYVVVDVDTNLAVWAGTSEEDANDFADNLWVADTTKDYLISKVCVKIEEVA